MLYFFISGWLLVVTISKKESRSKPVGVWNSEQDRNRDREQDQDQDRKGYGIGFRVDNARPLGASNERRDFDAGRCRRARRPPPPPIETAQTRMT
ncbi:hypothetical protein EVAR_95432_1 [Eumeta japonica]|uniref:Secreted protein n=1 Tax=Eumeta variegata TaxID=151549 RepID=A0A4C1VIW5_EUMVA|nr:hypothetical protein EVAR_95432_1 [Eumeta japonica]